MLFLAEVEDCSDVLRNDEMEKLVEGAVAAAGFPNPAQARRALEWVFSCPRQLS
jgi:hypothetical protein